MLGVSVKDVRIASGEKSNLKTIRVEREIEEVKAGLEQILGED
jgi:uncharacterized protein YggU (UPF0235/DUF167 family)